MKRDFLSQIQPRRRQVHQRLNRVRRKVETNKLAMRCQGDPHTFPLRLYRLNREKLRCRWQRDVSSKNEERSGMGTDFWLPNDSFPVSFPLKFVRATPADLPKLNIGSALFQEFATGSTDEMEVQPLTCKPAIIRLFWVLSSQMRTDQTSLLCILVDTI